MCYIIFGGLQSCHENADAASIKQITNKYSILDTEKLDTISTVNHQELLL
jgi:hypothetical protein